MITHRRELYTVYFVVLLMKILLHDLADGDVSHGLCHGLATCPPLQKEMKSSVRPPDRKPSLRGGTKRWISLNIATQDF